MHKSVRKHYEPRPDSLRNTADDEPIDPYTVENFRRLEQAISNICTQQEVSVTIEPNE